MRLMESAWLHSIGVAYGSFLTIRGTACDLLTRAALDGHDLSAKGIAFHFRNWPESLVFSPSYCTRSLLHLFSLSLGRLSSAAEHTCR